MTFSEKIKNLRAEKNMKQSDLAKLAGVTTRTVAGWESQGRFPRKRELYQTLADIFGCDVTYLMGSEESFMTSANEEYGSRGAKQAQLILDQAYAMFAGGELSEADKVAFMDQIQEMYLDSKKKAKKFTRKDYLEKKTEE